MTAIGFKEMTARKALEQSAWNVEIAISYATVR